MMHLELTAYPTEPVLPPPPPPDPEPEIDPKLLAIMGKYKYNWRLSMLAMPKWPVHKYVPPPDDIPQGGKFLLLDPEMDWRCDQLSRKTLRYLVITKKENKEVLGTRFVAIMDKNIENSWNSIYNYYKKRLMLRRRKRKEARDRKLAPLKKKKAVEKEKRINESTVRLAKPKGIFQAQKQPREWKPLMQLIARIVKLAMPKERATEPLVELTKVSPAALTYQITEHTMTLAQTWPVRYRVPLPPPLVPGAVFPAALKALVSPRLKELATPVVNAQVKREEEKADTWTINPFALKYKATPRIIELAKPKERD